MKNKLQQSDSGNQLRPVILLLAIAVILPTVCLLWFMVQAAGNESLALRQKMVNNYEERLKASVNEKLSDDEINRHIALVMSDGFIVFDGDGRLTFPVDDETDPLKSESVFEQAFELEYAEKDLEKAITEYLRIAKDTVSKDIAIKANISNIRCLRQLDRNGEAINQAESIVSQYEDSSKYIRSQKCHAYLLLMELCKDRDKEQYNKILSDAFDHFTQGMYHNDDMAFLGRKSHVGLYIPSSLQLLALNRFIEYAGERQDDPAIAKKYKYATYLSSQVDTSLQLALEYSGPDFAKPGIINSSVFRLKGNEPYYGIYRVISGYTYLKIYSKEHVASWFNELVEEIEDEMVYCRIYDDKGELIAGTAPVYIGKEVVFGQKFSTLELDGYMAGWKAEMYFYAGTFSDAAKRQRIIYFVTAGIIVLLIGAASTMATKSIMHQAAVNRLKNDFVATVTHELKTPLASMRVLVDTLLEGNYNDQQQAKEYLELIAKENKRLTGLIDNFLTFSRMERNKQAFEMVPASAKAIALAAAEAVKTKFNGGICKFTVTIDDDLASISADTDAMVTVLVNLLDNAYKYSGDEKEIELAVYDKNGQMCFAVKDNGIGMSNRAMKKIFERFYQVDSRLSRDAEGCGLGLSIVKFIVDAHDGTIEVDSETGKGSVFVVKIPTQTKG